MGGKGCAAKGVFAFAAAGSYSNPSKHSEPEFHLYQSTSRRYGRFEKSGPQSIGRTRGGWNTKLHMAAASGRDGVILALPAGNCGDASEGRSLLRQLSQMDRPVYLLMDRACEGDETRALAAELGYMPAVPPKSNRKNPWDYDKQLYKQRNQVERLFRRLRRFENDCVCIIAPICQKIFRLESLDQLCCNCAIRCGTRSGKESHRHTMRIHGQMYIGVEPPFVRPIA